MDNESIKRMLELLCNEAGFLVSALTRTLTRTRTLTSTLTLCWPNPNPALTLP